MLLVFLYKVTSTYCSSLLPCLSTHLSHLSPNTDRCLPFSRHIVTFLLCLPCVFPMLGTSSTTQSLPGQFLLSKSRLNVISPEKPANLSGSACCCFLCVLSALCSFSTSYVRYLLLWAVKPSMAGTVVNLFLDPVSNTGPGTATSQSMVTWSVKSFLFHNFSQSPALSSASTLYPKLSLGLSALIFSHWWIGSKYT